MYVFGVASDLLQALAAWFSDEPHSRHHGDDLLSRATVRHIDSVRQRWGVPGMAVAVVTSPRFKHNHLKDSDADQIHDAQEGSYGKNEKRGKVQLLNFGTATNAGAPVDSDSLFCIASNSKLFTALSVLKMIDDGVSLPNGERLSLASKIKDVLPEWGLEDEYASDVVDVADLMSMRSGLSSHDFSYADVPPAETVANMRHLRSTAEVRQTFQYQNGHYVALSHIVPTLAGVPFIEYVRTHFFAPLGMNATTYNHTAAAESGRRTDGHTHRGVNMTECVAKSHLNPFSERHKHGRKGGKKHSKRPASCHGDIAPFGWFTATDGIANAGPGGVVSSARDVATWLQELLDPKVVAPQLLEAAATPRTIITGPTMPGADGIPSLYGAGQVIEHYRGHRVVSHTGGVPGQLTLIARLPEVGVGVAILTNDADFGFFAFYVAFAAILDDLLGLTLRDTEPDWFALYLSSAPGPAKQDGKEPEYGLSAVPGTYEGAGYGTIELAPLDETDPMQARFPAELERFGLANRHVFVAPYKRIFSTHLVFSHWDGPHFNWTIFIAHDQNQGFGKGTHGSGSAVITLEGIGMFGRFSTPGAGIPTREPVVDNVEEACEVWFARK